MIYTSKWYAAVHVHREIGLAAGATYVFLAAKCHGDKTECWPSIQTIADETGLNRRTVQRAIASLVAGGMVSTSWSRHRSSRTYRLLHIAQRGRSETAPGAAYDTHGGGLRPPEDQKKTKKEPEADPEPLEGGSGPLTEPVERDGQLYFESTTEMLAWHRRMKDAG